jgi:hypothetical protein
MKIRALANGNVIEAHDDAAKELIEAGIYEKVSDKEPLSAESSQPPGSSAIAAPKATVPKPRGRRKKNA